MLSACCSQSDKLEAARATSEHSNVQRLEELTHAFAKIQDATGTANSFFVNLNF